MEDALAIFYKYAFPAMWLAYFGYWWAVSRNVKAPVRQEPAPSRVARLVLMVSAGLLLGLSRIPFSPLDKRFFPSGDGSFWSGAVVTAAGLLFSVWARRHLGSNWSQNVTVKQGHELIQSGPYRFVRHPIYTGLLVAFLGSAIARGEWRGLLAVALVFITLWNKLRLEEKWMRAEFGESYRNYSRRVAALVPHIL
ncbi:MAG TPA: isoprenylcysteine carboxylmethyltransferase family protein [Terriglobales bacterium]|nr:isoprenylcysteine carboxylmethyltransferase family protein [Terriglobales bacterium]